jgi:hypothetical protein
MATTADGHNGRKHMHWLRLDRVELHNVLVWDMLPKNMFFEIQAFRIPMSHRNGYDPTIYTISRPGTAYCIYQHIKRHGH